MVERTENLDTKRLSDYLASNIDGFDGLYEVEKFSSGQSNPTYLLRAESGNYVLRHKPSGKLLASAHAIDREFRVIRALAQSEVPVARAYHLCRDASIIGSMFYVMSFVDGHVFWDPALPEVDRAMRASYHLDVIRVLANLHRVDVDGLGLGDFGQPGNYFNRQISRWSKQYRASETHRIDAMESLLDWLPLNVPPDSEEACLIHGDYNFENVMFHPQKPQVIAVLDWELSTLGHPLADLAYHCMRLRLPRSNSIKGLAELDRTQLGIPTEQALVSEYCNLVGRHRIQNWNFFMAFSFFRLTAIVQGVLKRALVGNASSARALEVGKLTEPLSIMGAELIR